MFFENDNFNIDIISVFYIDRCKKSDRSSNRAHYALSYRVKGDGVFTEAGESMTAHDGDIVLVPPSSDYFLTNGEEKLYVIHFLCEDMIASKIKKLSPSDPQYIHGIFTKMHAAYREKKPGYKYKCKSLFFKLVCLLEEELTFAETHKPNKYLSLAIEYINKHFTDPCFSVERTAKHLNISSVYLRKLFSQGMNCS
ncbi:MAG: hypothetical protein IJ391_04605, partial [Clostridia bacterium]|nr:hypothetical protein [Clostridia bacterium]